MAMEEAELGHHQRFHDPQRSYHCQVCFYRFEWKGGRDAHIRTAHNKIANYKCTHHHALKYIFDAIGCTTFHALQACSG